MINKIMNLIEMFDELPQGYSTETEDNTQLHLSDLRKTKLTLVQLNRLRIMNDIRKLEFEKNLDKVKQQYKAPAQSAMPM
jgi:hypothetical protein